MPPYVHALATAVPEPSYSQTHAHQVMRSWIGGERRTERLLAGIYRRSGIRTRHSVIEDFAPDGPPKGEGHGFYLDADGRFRSPGTAERNARYRREAGHLFPEVARRALASAEGFDASDVTHVVTASCTGFYAPGPDLEIVRDLGLGPGTERYHLGFMGCYAAFPALRMARAFCRADPNAVVLVAMVELCTLHLQPTREDDAMIAASVFADGGAAAVVSARDPRGPAYELVGFADGLAPRGHDDMAWTLGDHGFEMVLSSYVPGIVADEATSALDPLLAEAGVSQDEVPRWAVHPGGRAILDRLDAELSLPADALTASRQVLAAYGNMSSATVMFVLQELLREERPRGEPVLALAFGPGLTVASGLLRRT
ncbi:MAG: type III polyketide synthase [Trueperaceae bacterium]|nr:type III polyketide synthase [Trueperaceae bacterium]